MRHGSVYQRHTRHCPRDHDGHLAPHRCRGHWAYVVEYGRDSSGRRLQSTKGGFATKAQAQAALQEAVRVLMADVNVHGLTVAEYLDTWLLGKRALKPKTRSLYDDAIRLYLKPQLGRILLLELRPHHLDRLYAAIAIGRRGRPLSPASLRRVHAVLRSALGTAVKRRLIPYNPALHIELAPENPQRPRPWSLDECRSFLEVTRDDRLASLYLLMLTTGMRRGEAVGLRWCDVDLDAGYLHVVQQITEVREALVVGTPKTKRGARVVPIDVDLARALCLHRESQLSEERLWGGAWQATGLVFTREDGRPLRPEYVTRHFQALTRVAGLPPIRLHDLRHTNASLALSAGVDIKIVSDRLGHSTTAITADLYTHVHRGVGREAADRIAATLRSARGHGRAVPSPFLAHAPQGEEIGGGLRGIAAGQPGCARRDSNPQTF